MPNFLNREQIMNLYNDAMNQGKKVFYRTGYDYRHGSSSQRNKTITLQGLLHQANNYYIKVEEKESDAGQIVFHGYSCLDME